jgi:hypothetical protein
MIRRSRPGPEVATLRSQRLPIGPGAVLLAKWSDPIPVQISARFQRYVPDKGLTSFLERLSHR